MQVVKELHVVDWHDAEVAVTEDAMMINAWLGSGFDVIIDAKKRAVR